MKASRFRSHARYEYLNVNPKSHVCDDCAIRAIAAITGRTWEETLSALFPLALRDARLPSDPDLFSKYLASLGFVRRGEPRDANNKKMSISAFLDSHPESQDFVCLAGSHHLTCVIGGKVRDIWDCSRETMHRWWEKPKD